MNDDHAEFLVHHWSVDEAGRFTVLGRCVGAPIRVGETFDLVFRNKRRKFPEEAGDEPVRVAEKPASLRVICIHAYEQSLSALGPCMGGSLVIEGEGAQYIAAGWILGKRDWSRPLIDDPVHTASPTPVAPG